MNLKTPKNKKIYLFGSGIVAKKTLEKFKNLKVAGIYDNSSNLWESNYLNLKIKDPKKINKLNDFIIITSTSFSAIKEQLIRKKLVENLNFVVSPLLKDLQEVEKIEKLQKKILFTSGSPPQSNINYGGGIYMLEINKNSHNIKKIVSGNCYGTFKKKKSIIAVDENRGLIEIKNKKINKIKSLKKGLRPHGLAYSSIHSKYYLCCTELDSIMVFDKNFNELDEIKISDKRKKTGIKHHHLNDCVVIDNSLYISMFSISGNYGKEFYDGTILEVDLDNFKNRNILKNDLWMPHNIKFFNNSIHILNSFSGELLGYNMKVLGKFPGFTRGLNFDGEYYYIGQSRNRNFSKYLGDSLNISLDTGIIIFDPIRKISRFIQLDPRISEIHSIEIL